MREPSSVVHRIVHNDVNTQKNAQNQALEYLLHVLHDKNTDKNAKIRAASAILQYAKKQEQQNVLADTQAIDAMLVFLRKIRKSSDNDDD